VVSSIAANEHFQGLQKHILVSAHHGHPQGEIQAFSPLGNWVMEPKISGKPEVSSLIPINLFNPCNDSLFAGMTSTLHKSQVSWSAVMHSRACSLLMSAPSPVECWPVLPLCYEKKTEFTLKKTQKKKQKNRHTKYLQKFKTNLEMYATGTCI